MSGYNTITDYDVDLDAYAVGLEESPKLIPAQTYADQVIEHFYGDTGKAGLHLPWAKTHSNIKLRPGEVSIWSGVNGHGKSMLLSQVILQAMAHSDRVCIASMEMKPVKTMARMTRQAAGTDQPEIAFIRAFHDWTESKLWLYDQQGTVKPDRILGLLSYCAKGGANYKGQKVKIHHFVIDSLMKCGIGVDDYNGQKAFVNALCACAYDTGIHVHLVTHSRKRDSERHVSDKFDVKGTSEITDQVDNVFTVWRNKNKEDEAQKNVPDPETMKEPDAMLICSKQRHGDDEGKFTLWFDKRSQQYVERERGYPQTFFDYDPVPL